MAEKITTIFFDLGYTLINFEGNVPRILRKSYSSLADSLIHSGINIDRKAFVRQYEKIINRYYAARETDHVEQPASIFVNRALACFDHPAAAPEVLTEAIAAMYKVTEAHWHLEKDTHPTLVELKNKGYRLGIISNASNTEDLNRLVDNAGLRQYFDAIIISAEEGIRKPDERIFAKALTVMNSTPGETLMVGDTLGADILGAQKAGIYAIWISRRAKRPENLRVRKKIKPNKEISRLSQIPKIADS